jgi:hypothetical protein
MIVEYAQMLSAAHHCLGTPSYAEKLYKKTHVNHPCSVWVRESSDHYDWLFDLLVACGLEYEHRFGKIHKTITNYEQLLSKTPTALKVRGWVEPPKCMFDEYKAGTTIEAYCRFIEAKYIDWSTRTDKRKMPVKWTNRKPPVWVTPQTLKVVKTLW